MLLTGKNKRTMRQEGECAALLQQQVILQLLRVALLLLLLLRLREP